MDEKNVDMNVNNIHHTKTHKLTSGSAELDSKIREWLAWDKNKRTVEQVKDLVRKGAFDQLRSIFMNRLTYTIDGFKGPVGPGYRAINDVVIIQCGQGLLRYLEINEWKKLKSSGIVIGYDARQQSKRFGDLLATVFVQKNYPVKLFNVVVPGILVARGIDKYSSAAGVMIGLNAGTNQENGLQIYDSCGVQLVNPADAEFQDCINGSLEPLNSSWETSILNNTELKTNPLSDVLKEYLDMIHMSAMQEYREINKKSSIKFVYTPLHGVGFIYMARALEVVHIRMIPVDEEKYPSPIFSMNDVPDFKGDLKLEKAIEVAKKQQSEYIIANNPDCSRVVVAERNPDTGEYTFFNADEIALLLAWWNYHIFQNNVHTKEDATNLYMIGNIFNTKLVKQMARIDGFYFMESFGGKWLGYSVKQLMDQDKPVIFAFDGYGYIVNTTTYAKDGIHAGVQLATFINYLTHHRLTLKGHLEEMYKRYGFYASMKFYFQTDNEEQTNTIYQNLRNHKGVPEYPRSMNSGKYVIKFIRDLKNKLDTAEENRKTTLPDDPNIELLSFKFDNYAEVTLYNYKLNPLSVTFHASINGTGNTPQEQANLRSVLSETAYAFINEFLEPIKDKVVFKC